ncbi:VOC family protein [soil metagenome]
MDTAIQSRSLDAKPIAPSLFAHFVLRSAQMPAMVEWYSTVLDMHVVKRNDFICFLTYDEEHHRLAIVNIAALEPPNPKGWGLAHVAYTFRDVGELLSTYRRLKAKGIVPYRPIHHGPTLSMYYHDPDGNSVEMQVDCFRTKAEASAYFQTEAFTRNPIGVNFDPEALVAAYERGAPEAELLRQPDGPAARAQGL